MRLYVIQWMDGEWGCIEEAACLITEAANVTVSYEGGRAVARTADGKAVAAMSTFDDDPTSFADGVLVIRGELLVPTEEEAQIWYDGAPPEPRTNFGEWHVHMCEEE